MRSRQYLVLVVCGFMALSLSTDATFAYQDTSDVPPKPLDEESKPKADDSDSKDDKKPAPRPTVRKTYTRAELLARTRMLASSRMPNMWGDFFDGTPYPLTLNDLSVLPPDWLNESTSPGAQLKGLRLPRAGGLGLRRVKRTKRISSNLKTFGI